MLETVSMVLPFNFKLGVKCYVLNIPDLNTIGDITMVKCKITKYFNIYMNGLRGITPNYIFDLDLQIHHKNHLQKMNMHINAGLERSRKKLAKIMKQRMVRGTDRWVEKDSHLLLSAIPYVCVTSQFHLSKKVQFRVYWSVNSYFNVRPQQLLLMFAA